MPADHPSAQDWCGTIDSVQADAMSVDDKAVAVGHRHVGESRLSEREARQHGRYGAHFSSHVLLGHQAQALKMR